MHILVYSMGTKATRRKAAVHYSAHSLSRGNLKNLMPRSFTFVCPLYCCSSKHNNNKALRIKFNSCKTVYTCSTALATVNIDKLIKVTSASSYVYAMVPFVYCRVAVGPGAPRGSRSLAADWSSAGRCSVTFRKSYLFHLCH